MHLFRTVVSVPTPSSSPPAQLRVESHAKRVSTPRSGCKSINDSFEYIFLKELPKRLDLVSSLNCMLGGGKKELHEFPSLMCVSDQVLGDVDAA